MGLLEALLVSPVMIQRYVSRESGSLVERGEGREVGRKGGRERGRERRRKREKEKI